MQKNKKTKKDENLGPPNTSQNLNSIIESAPPNLSIKKAFNQEHRICGSTPKPHNLAALAL